MFRFKVISSEKMYQLWWNVSSLIVYNKAHKISGILCATVVPRQPFFVPF